MDVCVEGVEAEGYCGLRPDGISSKSSGIDLSGICIADVGISGICIGSIMFRDNKCGIWHIISLHSTSHS